jgi:hypothetical protein
MAGILQEPAISDATPTMDAPEDNRAAWKKEHRRALVNDFFGIN